MKLVKYILMLGFGISLIGCSETPNNISMYITDGTCVQVSQYASSTQASQAIANYPQIESNPTAPSPYCAAVTVNNANSGDNANTVQITNAGLGVSYNVGSQLFNGVLYDPVAAGLTITGLTQQIGNIAIFDPKNCVTTQGANVQYLNTNGGNCTFYLQLMNESFPVGVYATTLVYNYTNGNTNYSVANNINQRTYLYAGASNGIYFLSSSVIATSQNPTSQASWSTGLTGAPSTSVSFITQSPLYGYVYFTTGNNVYLFNGTSAIQLGANLPAPVISIAFDNQLNPYAATTNGIYVYYNNTWTQVVDTFNNANANLIGLDGIESVSNPNVLYAYNESQMYTCRDINLTSFTMNCAPQINQAANPSIFFPNATAIDATSGALYAGAYFAFNNQYSIGFLPTQQWVIPPYTINPPITSTLGAYSYIGGLIWVPSNVSGSSNTLYFGVYNESAITAQNESAVYSCSTIDFLCNPQLSESSANNIVGNVRAVANDGAGNIYVAGLQLNSNDFESYAITNTLGSFLITSPTTISQGGVSIWGPILNGSITTGPVNTVVVSSMLTSY